MRPIELGFVFCAFMAVAPASAQVYRWVDDRGVINYAAKPPDDGRPVARIDGQDSRASIILTAPRGPRPSLPPAAGLPPAAPSFPGLVDRATIGALTPQWHARCIAERRVNCESPAAATSISLARSRTTPAFGSRVVR